MTLQRISRDRKKPETYVATPASITEGMVLTAAALPGKTSTAAQATLFTDPIYNSNCFTQAPEVLSSLNMQVEEGAEVEDEVGGEAGEGAEASQKMRRTLLLLSRTHLLLSQ